ncbi:hypothetical protein M3Y97_00406200 [Aphelenchoides bicaudatus]|nr:hypothetical protein M3Y97_00406200 [Aphelenchoides bicaudatus]
MQETRLVRASERILSIYLSAIYPLCNIRNSFLIMALSPNLIDLCLQKLPTTKRWFFQNFPIIHRNILAIAFTFAKTHEFFVATSSLNQTNKFVGESPSSLFCQHQINALSVLLSHSELLASETMEFLIDWLFSLVSSFGSGIQMICDRNELLPLRKTVLMLYFNDGVSTTKLDNIADNLKVFDIMNDFNEEESKQFLERFGSSLKLKRSLENSHQLWKKTPALFVDKLFLRTNCNIKVNEEKLNQISLFDRVFQIKIFLFQHNKNMFDRRFSRSNIDQQFYSKPQWDIVLKLFADDISQNTSFLPSISDTASLAIDEINKIRNETQPAQNSYHNTVNRQNPDRKERAHFPDIMSLVFDRTIGSFVIGKVSHN